MVAIEGFYDHSAKLEAAASEIAENNLFVGHGAFQRDAFQADAFQIAASASDWKVRLDAMFVQWVPQAADGLEGRWQWGVDADADVLANNIKAVGERLSRASVEWT